MKKDFCRKIRELRKKKDMTIIELSKMAGISNGQLSKIERGIHHPTQETIKKLANALKVDDDVLLDMAGYKINLFYQNEIDNDDQNTIFSDNLNKIRKQKNLTLLALSKLSGISTGGLSRIERGIQHPSRETIKKLSQALDVDEEAFLDMAGYKINLFYHSKIDNEDQNTNLKKDFCNTLRKIRKQRNLTIFELSELASISNGQLSKIERGINHPSQETIKKLSYALEVDENILLNMAGYKTKILYRGEIDSDVKFSIFKKFNLTCQICGDKAPNTIIQVAHILPLNLGGTSSADNLITLCVNCHNARDKFIEKKGIKDDLLINLYKAN